MLGRNKRDGQNEWGELDTGCGEEYSAQVPETETQGYGKKIVQLSSALTNLRCDRSLDKQVKMKCLILEVRPKSED